MTDKRPSHPHYHDWIEGPDGYHSACAGCGKPYPKNDMPPLVLAVVEAIENAWVATWEELEDEARTVMGAFAKWLEGLPDGLRPSDIAAEVRVQIVSKKGSGEVPVEVGGKPFHGWSCECADCEGYDEAGVPRPGEKGSGTSWPEVAGEVMAPTATKGSQTRADKIAEKVDPEYVDQWLSQDGKGSRPSATPESGRGLSPDEFAAALRADPETGLGGYEPSYSEATAWPAEGARVGIVTCNRYDSDGVPFGSCANCGRERGEHLTAPARVPTPKGSSS